ASYSYYHQTNDDLATINYKYSDGNENLQQDWLQTYDYLEPENYNQIEVSWAQTFAKEGTKLLVLFQNDFWDNDEQELTIVSESFPTSAEAFQLRTRDIESSNDYLLQTDYEQKLGEYGKLELGLRGETRIISSDYLAELKEDDVFMVYRNLENLVDYHERIGAAYAQYAFEKDKWGVQVGLRSEYTNVKVEDTQAETKDINKSYNWVFPSSTVSYKFSENLNASLGYSKRIQRPRFWQLNPFGGISNPNELRFGNADLDPSYRDLIELKVLFKTDRLTISPQLAVHYIDGFYDTQVLQDSNGLVTYLPINLDQERILNAGLIVSYEPFKSWQINGEFNAAEFKQRGFYEGVDFGNSFQTYNLELGVRGKLPKDIRMQLNFYYYGGQRYLQSYRDPYYGINGGLSRKFLEDRLQVSLNVRNLFALSVYRGGATLPTFTNSYERQWQGQRIGLTVAWDIGADVRARRARGSIR
ncbi:MAG: outer membrane beta-barrel family protein, partial [Bacteroidia bacterium]|nr:outer membrane beta-barrel family protein [Bacteroidia bacterium]